MQAQGVVADRHNMIGQLDNKNQIMIGQHNLLC